MAIKSLPQVRAPRSAFSVLLRPSVLRRLCLRDLPSSAPPPSLAVCLPPPSSLLKTQ
ncbi:hypothetical protein SESBI_50756, partial [Sesbania bispinosa]